MADSHNAYETYLGDGAYVKLTEFGDVVLYTTDGINQTNVVYLEPQCLEVFKLWLIQRKLYR